MLNMLATRKLNSSRDILSISPSHTNIQCFKLVHEFPMVIIFLLLTGSEGFTVQYSVVLVWEYFHQGTSFHVQVAQATQTC